MTKKPRPEKAARDKGRKRDSRAGMDANLRTTIGAQLRALHQNVIEEGIPDRFRELLDRLDNANSKD